MANFKTHLNGAFAVSGALSIVGYKAGLLGGHEFLMCVALGTIGGLLPDIDSDNSTPIKLGFDFASLLVAFSLVMHWRSELSLLSLMALWLAGYGLMRYGVFYVFTKITVHRGIIHSIPYMAVLALGLVMLNYHLLDTNAMTSWFYGLFLFIGSMVHLGLDEAYSVDLLNSRLKRSSGTAMKLYSDSARYWYVGLYALLVVGIVVAPPFKEFWSTLTDPITWLILKDGLLPKELFSSLTSAIK